MRAALLLAFLAAPAALPALAACPNESEIFSCTVEGKPLQICHWKGALVYNYGPKDKPDLSLSEPMETVAFTPWPGIGSAIWEMVAFQNAGYTYEVWTSMERDPGADQSLQGGVNVIEGGSLVAELRCDPGSPSQPLEAIFELKEAIGQCWDFGSQSWQTSCDG